MRSGKNYGQRKGLTQKALAVKMQGKVDYSYIGKIERGEQLPSLKMLKRLSEALAVPLSYFFQGVDGKETAQTEAQRDSLDRQRERLLLHLLRTVHDDDLLLLSEIARILTKHRNTRRMTEGDVQGTRSAADPLHAAEGGGEYKRR
ncbi:MAG: helix-turn-helix transcriptional regulator [Nitrospinae bacterium]|nr:helix-turn-helix transcriptional regulator [Nitrospinota bacterium]